MCTGVEGSLLGELTVTISPYILSTHVLRTILARSKSCTKSPFPGLLSGGVICPGAEGTLFGELTGTGTEHAGGDVPVSPPELVWSIDNGHSFILFFAFIRRFWNQILTWVSFRFNAVAISILLARCRYRVVINSFSSSVSCLVEKFVRPVPAPLGSFPLGVEEL